MEKTFENWLVVSDIDGTLNNKARKLPRRNYDAIKKFTDLGGNLSTVSPNSGAAVIRSPRGDLAQGIEKNSGAYGDIIQGCLEASNVDLTEQFTDMITTQRGFQSNAKTIQTSDTMLETVLSLKR